MILNTFRRWVRGIERRVWIAILGLGVFVLILFSLPSQSGGITPEMLQPTIDAAATQTSIPYATLQSALTLTPIEAMVTEIAPTIALQGGAEVQQYAASASADSARGELDWGAIQAAGPPNTESCGDFRTAWATITPNGQGVLTLYYPELVTPTRIIIHQSFNPGFVQHVNMRDLYGEQHTVYTTTPFPSTTCPEALVIDIIDADFAGNTVIIYLDQRGSTAGWTEIDAVQLIGKRYN